MKGLLFFLIVFFSENLLFSQDLLLSDPPTQREKDNPYLFTPPPKTLSIFQTIGAKHYTGFEDLIYENYLVRKKKLSSSLRDELFLQTQVFYGLRFLYQYFYVGIEAGYVLSQHNFYNQSKVKGLSSKVEAAYLTPEVGFKFMFVSLIFGDKFYFGRQPDRINHIENYNFNDPYVNLLLDLKWGHLPLWTNLGYGVNFSSNSSPLLHKAILGLRWAMTYYSDLYISYEPTFTASFLDSAMNLQLNFQITKGFSVTTNFKSSVYNDNRPVNNQVYLAINYLINIDF